jgi:raffinose/stachyose/melibiose transport system permease protein
MKVRQKSRASIKYDIQRAFTKTFKQIFMVIYAVIALIPMYFMFVTSLKREDDFLVNKFGLPSPPVIQDYITALRGGEKFLKWLLNTSAITILSVLITLMFALLAAFIFANYRFKFKNIIFNTTVALMVMPPVVMIVPLFVLFSKLKLVNNFWGIIIVYIGIALPFSIYVLTNFIKTIPKEIIEAAHIDGCSTSNILLKIVLPLTLPTIVTICVVNALYFWNELLIAVVFLQNEQVKTLMAGIMSFKSRYNTDLPVTMAGLSMMSIPMIILYFSATRYFVKGLTSGSIKG